MVNQSGLGIAFIQCCSMAPSSANHHLNEGVIQIITQAVEGERRAYED